MPELPEVETIVRQLAGHLPGRRVQDIEVCRADLLRESAEDFSRGLQNRDIVAITRRGKNILLSLSDQSLLLVNLGMTGRLLFRADGSTDPPPTHLGIRFQLRPGGSLLYTDIRRFGHLLRYSKAAWGKENRRLGPEPLGRWLTHHRFHTSLQTSRAPIRSWLLDQKRVVGIGNIYAAEALFRAGVHPFRNARGLNQEESKALLKGIRKVLREAIWAQGTTLRDYRTASGGRGGFGPSLQVYGRAGEECPTCKAAIERIVFANRSAFFCPHCQPEVL